MSVSGLDPQEFDLTDLRRAWLKNQLIDVMVTDLLHYINCSELIPVCDAFSDRDLP